ncbi:MAG TPA: FtsX-like permease family protein, partial [Thermoanaerobaculia bacterium]|nr:FtsX-like permease family protein [Thermoanaerobaculia bacterium]
LAPALQASRANANEILKDEGRGSTSLRMGRFTRAIVVLEVAFSCALLVGAGLMIKSVVEVRKLNLGFESRDMLTLRIALFEAAYPRKQDRARFWEQLLPRLSALPGVETVAATSFLPTAGSETERYAVEGRAYATPQDLPSANQDAVSAGYFHAFGSRILAGRDFGRQDREGSLPVVIVNQSFAAKVWPRQEPLGRRLRLGDGKDGKAPWRTVVGLVPDLQMGGIDPQAKPEGFYLPIAQDCPVRVSVALKAHSDPLALTPLVRGEVTALDHDLPIYFVRSMEEVLAKSAFFFNLFGVLFSIFGVSALVLASVGIYGIIAFSVHQRTQEIGVRMALGAQKRNVLRMILQQGMTQLGLGLGIGLVFAFAVSRLLGQMLFRVQPSDPATFAAVCVVLATVALFACLIPAQRASRIDPLVAIRYD